MYKVIEKCRSCGYRHLETILDLGQTTLADALLWEDQLGENEVSVPLVMVLCQNCSLVQINATVSPEILYCRDYSYFSSVSHSLVKHFQSSAQSIIESKKLNEHSMVIEAGSNDGIMLKNFVKEGIPVLGIEPAAGPLSQSKSIGIDTMATFFDKGLATKLCAEGNQADVFLANNVLSHVDDLNGFVEGVKILLKDDGIAVIELPYVLDLVDNVEFDTIYHQNLCYFSVTSLDHLFRKHDLFLNRVENIKTHGGSLRLFVEPSENVQDSVRSLMYYERGRGISSLSCFIKFTTAAETIKYSFPTFLLDLVENGKKIVGYGAAAKATTLMSYCGIDASLMDYIVDLNPIKHGRYMSGTHIPVYSTSRLLEDMPDYVLIMAWNFSKEIISQQRKYYQQGGEFIVPIPSPRIIHEEKVQELYSKEGA